MHDVLNLLIFGFFCVLVMFEDIVFVIFPDKRGCLAIFPLLMLAVVFNILCEGTVYGNSIARKPWHDTIGIGLGALSNFGLCALLVPAFGLTGAALALAVGYLVLLFAVQQPFLAGAAQCADAVRLCLNTRFNANFVATAFRAVWSNLDSSFREKRSLVAQWIQSLMLSAPPTPAMTD